MKKIIKNRAVCPNCGGVVHSLDGHIVGWSRGIPVYDCEVHDDSIQG